MNPMTNRLSIALMLALTGLSGCAGNPAPAPKTQPAPVEPVVTIGPPASAPTRPTGTPDPVASAPSEPAPMTPTDLARTDGRPGWWIDEPQAASGRLYLAVEALGVDVRSARRAAVDSGIAALARMLGHDPVDDRVHATTVRPLPYRGGTNEGMRYIGYVLVSSEAPE